MKKWDFGDDEEDELAREAGVDPCDLDNWRPRTWAWSLSAYDGGKGLEDQTIVAMAPIGEA